jgi:hypothetical protein
MLLSLVLMLAGTSARASDFAARYAAWQSTADMPAPAAAPTPTTTYTPRPTAGGLGSTHGYHLPDSYNESQAAHAHCPTCGPGGGGHAIHSDHSYGPSYGPAYEAGPYFDGPADYGPGGDCGSCGPGGCGGCGSGGCGGCGDFGCNTMVWARFEVLLWWREGRAFPPLVTTDPVTEPSTTAGILPDATTLFGGEVVASDMAAGGRFDVGTWFDPRQCYGVGWRFWGLGKDGLNFNVNSLQNPVLAIPFIDFATGDNEAFLVAYPGLRTGEINVSASSEVLGNDVYGRFLLCRTCDSRWDFITGWHFSRINDDVTIRSENVNTDPGGGIPLGRTTTVRDHFGVQNEFHGGILGLMWERECGCLTTQIMGRMSLGNMRETSFINGSFTTQDPGLDPVTVQGGLFTADSNIGTRQRDEFTAVTEVGVNLSYRCNNCTELTLGYTFLYWNDIARPENSIDTRIGTNAGEDRPQFEFRHADYWVQGLSLGLTREF